MKRRSLDKLNKQLTEFETRILDFDVKTDSVSSGSIGWHLEHSFLVLNGVIDNMRESDPDKFKRKFSFAKFYCFTIKRFPRGKARSPKSVKPTGHINEDNLLQHLDRTLENVSRLSTLNKGVFFKHPLFGNLKLRDSIYFLELHSEHHLKIIREIKGHG